MQEVHHHVTERGAKQSEGGDVEVYAAPRAQSGSCAPEKFRGTTNLKTHLGVIKNKNNKTWDVNMRTSTSE